MRAFSVVLSSGERAILYFEEAPRVGDTLRWDTPTYGPFHKGTHLRVVAVVISSESVRPWEIHVSY